MTDSIGSIFPSFVISKTVRLFLVLHLPSWSWSYSLHFGFASNIASLHNGETGVAVAVYTMAMTFTSFVFARGHQCGCARTNQRRGLIEIIHAAMYSERLVYRRGRCFRDVVRLPNSAPDSPKPPIHGRQIRRDWLLARIRACAARSSLAFSRRARWDL